MIVQIYVPDVSPNYAIVRTGYFGSIARQCSEFSSKARLEVEIATVSIFFTVGAVQASSY